MTIIDHTNPKAAKFVYKHVDTDTMLTAQKEKYYDNEFSKWVLGTNSDGSKVGYTDDGLTGLQYFYYTQIRIKTQGGQIIRPDWRNDDEELIFQPLQHCMNSTSSKVGDVWDYMGLKRRRFGFTELLGKGLPIYYSLIKQGTNSLVTSADLSRLSDIFKSKIFVGLDNIDMKNPFFPRNSKGELNYRGTATKSNTYSTIFFPKVDKDDDEKESTIYGVETVQNPQNPEGYTLIYAFLDEIGLHPKPQKVRDSTDAALKVDLFRNGFMAMGGTCGEMTPENSKALSNMVKDSQHLKIQVAFILGYHSVKNFTTNGWTDHKAAIEWIEKDREEKYKASDKSAYYKAIKDYPLSPDEIFDTNQGCALPEYLHERWKQQYAITIKREAGKQGLLRRNTTSGYVEFQESQNAPFFFHRPPIDGNKHIFGSDPTPHNQASDIGSESALVGKDIIVGDYIGYYSERIDDSETVFQNNILFQDYLNFNREPLRADKYGKIMIEKNQGGALLERFILSGAENRLARKPKVFKWINVSYGDEKLVYGWQKAANAPYAYGYAEEYFRLHMEDIHIMRFLEEMKYWKKQNHDCLDALVSCEVYHKDIEKNIIADNDREQKVQVVSRVVNGKKVYMDVTLKEKYLDVPKNRYP